MIDSSKLKSILLMAANPKGTASLRIQEEEREIKEQLDLAGYREELVNSVGATRTIDIQRALLKYDPQIVHFMGHGVGQDGLAFEDETGQIKLVDSETLADIFKLFPRVECVVLNACYSAFQAKVISKYVDCVIGITKSINDHAAIAFSRIFYIALARGKSFKLAYDLGYNAIQMELGSAEESIPVIYEKKDALELLRQKQNSLSLISEQGVNYSELKVLLENAHSSNNGACWKEADYMTYSLMLQAAGKGKYDWIREKEMLIFPCSDLHIINDLWTIYSEGRFGFSSQNEIWNDVYDKKNLWRGKQFSTRIGWLNGQGSYKERDDLNFSLDAPKGHLPYILRINGRLRKESGFWLFPCLSERLKSCSQ